MYSLSNVFLAKNIWQRSKSNAQTLNLIFHDILLDVRSTEPCFICLRILYDFIMAKVATTIKHVVVTLPLSATKQLWSDLIYSRRFCE